MAIAQGGTHERGGFCIQSQHSEVKAGDLCEFEVSLEKKMAPSMANTALGHALQAPTLVGCMGNYNRRQNSRFRRRVDSMEIGPQLRRGLEALARHS